MHPVVSGQPQDNPRAWFARLARSPDNELDLGLGAALIAAEEYPELDVHALLATFDRYAEALQPRLARANDERTRLRSLIDYLHDELGFAGDIETYYDPKNSLLSDVVSRHAGIPISLAVVYLETARRVGVRLQGVSFPGHFLMRHGEREPVFIDPFNPHDFLSVEECKRLLKTLSSDTVTFDERHLAAAKTRQILVRMLRNLKLIYVQADDYERAIAAMDRILLLTPGEISEVRDRGIAYLQLDAYLLALPDLARYLEEAPHAPDRDAITAALSYAKERVDELN